MVNKEIYISVDIESDGPYPGDYSMLSLGAAAFNSLGVHINSFSCNFELLDDASQHPDTMKFWSENQKAYNATRTNCASPEEGMYEFVRWIQSLNGIPVFVGAPAGYDFTFVYWYLMKFHGESPFSHSAIDLKTLAMSLMKVPYRQAVKRNYPKHWFGKTKHTHIALDDAIEQGEIFANMWLKK